MLWSIWKKWMLFAIGPGLSTKEDVEDVVFSVVENCKVPMVIDADGLNLISRNLPVLKKARAPVVLTPHPERWQGLQD